MSASGWARLSGAMGIPFVVAYVLLLALSGSSPDDTSSDAKILDYYGSHSHRVKDITAFFIAGAGLLLLLWFLAHLRSMVSAAEGAGGRGAGLVTASGTAFVTLFTVAGCAFTAVPFVVNDAGSTFTLDPNTFRLVSGLGIFAYIAAFILGAPLAFTVGVVGWRTRVIPRWLAVVSFLGALGALASVVFIPSWVYVAWIGLLSLYLVFRPTGTGAPAAAAPAPTT